MFDRRNRGVRLRVALLGAPAALWLASCGSGVPESGSLSGWNVLLISVDTLRADRLGFAGYEAADTPVLDGLADDGVVFEDAVTAAPVTLPSHATILTGLYPPAHGALDNGFYSLPEDVPTLATELRQAGYETAAFVGAFVLHGQYGLDTGFDVYDDHFRNPRLPGQEHVERRAADVVTRAKEWLAARSGSSPFLLWVHCFDPHSPYDPPEPFRSRFPDSPYDGEIAYTDSELGVLMDAMRGPGLLERTLVVFVADHGEALGDGGEATHGLLLRGATLRVPFVLSAPAVLPSGRRVHGTVSTADVTPTVLDLLGIRPTQAMDGRSLLPEIESGVSGGRRVYSETRLPEDQLGWSMLAGARSDDWAYVRAPRPELYDLRSDPGEARNIRRDRPEIARGLDAIVEAVLGRARPAGRDALSPEEEDALRALGYVSGDGSPRRTGADPKDMLPLWNRLEEIQAAMAAGRFDLALPAVEELLRLDPGNREAHMVRGQALIRTGRTEEGVAELRKILAGGGNRGRTGTIIAQALLDAGRPDEAEALYRTLWKAEPELSEHPFNLGVLLWSQGRRAEAVEAYEAALANNPDAVHVLVNMAQALSRRDWDGADPDRAVRLMDRAIRIATDDRPSLFKIYLCSDLGRTEDAREVARALGAKRRLSGVTREELAAAIRAIDAPR